ncbi:BAX inhibitor (BI)-1/YccA family protein [Saccharibacter sp. 17.LH.SD]|uniref:Bax inhibitor-1/YccA family protein n=1 Tax=Saccharibacter sp. 17.LH.SD TaxID=2689393 RepID=UPI00136BB545|nr:Bax inhibitor-1/YccA family protein [Saccharibacter sp. 17.LH.SD]MXV44169.1 BAX inhibitor (BI)-1/YccA family protein [Saccharibacter sp. 17.LH.SD]
MAFNSDFRSAESQQGQVAFDAGLRAYMLRVFNWMAFALVLTAVSAYAVVHTSLRGIFFRAHGLANGQIVMGPSIIGMVAIFLPLVFVMVLSFGVNRLSRSAAQGIFILYSVAMGISLSSILLAYTGASVVRTFLIAASLYSAVALWGYVTNRSLSGFGMFLFMGLVGLMIAGLVNMFIPTSFMTTAISFVGVLLFSGYTAYDTQRIKMSYLQYMGAYSADDIGKLSIYDALSMYLNFVNLFQSLLQFVGVRSDDRG